MASPGKRTRGSNKKRQWSRDPDDGISVLRLAVDATDSRQRKRLESMFENAYRVKRALQRAARDKSRAYWAAKRERVSDAAATRRRLRLSRDGFEDAAFAQLDAAPHLRRFVTKALAQHIADAVWAGTERHLFRDTSGKRHGTPKIRQWYDFTRLPGRARRHEGKQIWETFRLHGTLAGHRAAYTDSGDDFVQPRRMRPVESKGWWNYQGPLAVVFSGLADGTLVLPVRLPTAPCNQPALDYYLADPSRWHKIDLVRRRDAHAAGGWRYEAHLMVLIVPYVSPATSKRRAQVAIAVTDRAAGIDINVSNLTIASHDTGRSMRLTRIERDDAQKLRERRRTKRERRLQRQLERSRRGANRARYHLSKRQEKRARRREDAGLRPIDVIPMGPRKARADGVPLQGYRSDTLSISYRRERAALAADAKAAAQARNDRARRIAAEVVATHGHRLVVEDCSIAAWASSWGRAVAAFSPGMLVTAIDREARAVAAIDGAHAWTGGVERASTRTTALSQHCPCGARVGKVLADRVHRCSACGLAGDRDDVAAVLASFVVLAVRGEPASARVDYAASTYAGAEIQRALRSSRSTYQGWQDTLFESTDLSASDGSSVTWWMSTPDHVAVARRNVGMASCSTLNETGASQTTSDRTRVRANRFRACVPDGRSYGTPLRRSSSGSRPIQSSCRAGTPRPRPRRRS